MLQYDFLIYIKTKSFGNIMKIYIIFLFLLKFTFSQGEGGENVEVIGHLEFGQNTSDITGFFQDGREFAAVGLQNSSVVVDISDLSTYYFHLVFL